MNRTIRDVTAAGVRTAIPITRPAQVKPGVIRLTLGDDLFAKVYPGVTIEP
jgi:hypothetical protein